MTLLLNDLDTTPYIPACSHRYKDVVIQSTKHVRQAIKILLRALERRSLALSKCANPDAAIRDANSIQLLQPSSAIGYLYEGDAYAQRGRQKMALAAYDKGLEAVSKDDPYYHRLEDGKAIAESAMNKRIDFLSQLPMDIVANCIAPMLMDDVEMTLEDMSCDYMQVSQTWHERILKSNCIHLSFQPKEGTSISDPSGSRQHERLKMIAPYVKSLSVVTTGSSGSYDYGDIHHLKFGSLRQLYINGRSNMASLCSTIRSIGSSSVLTHLEVIPRHHTAYGQKDESMTMQLSQILMLCPRLISLTLNHCETDMTALDSDQQYPAMKHLLLRYTATPITDEGMIDILRRVPSLQHLSAHPCSSLRPLTTLHQHCPSLKSLKYGTDQYVPYFFESYRGFQHVFQIWDERDVHAATRISFLLSCFGSKLEAFDYRCGYGLSNKAGASRYPITDDIAAKKICLPRLRKLDMDLLWENDLPGWIIENAPALNSIHLANAAINNKVIHAMTHLSSLENLHMISQPDGIHNDSLVQARKCFFETQSSLGDASRLKHLAFQVSNTPLLAWLLPVATLPKLETLGFRVGSFVDKEVAEFTKLLAEQCWTLREASFSSYHGHFETGVISPLKDLKTIETLYIHTNQLFKEDALALGECEALQKLHVTTLHKLELDQAVYLKKNVPEMYFQTCSGLYKPYDIEDYAFELKQQLKESRSITKDDSFGDHHA